MTRDEFTEVLNRAQAEELALREQGQAEYAHDSDDCFRNFNDVGKRVRCPHCHKPIGPFAVLMVYLLKHIDGMLAWVGGHRSQREDVRGRIKDVRMYAALMWGMANEEEALAVAHDPHAKPGDDGSFLDRMSTRGTGRLEPVKSHDDDVGPV